MANKKIMMRLCVAFAIISIILIIVGMQLSGSARTYTIVSGTVSFVCSSIFYMMTNLFSGTSWERPVEMAGNRVIRVRAASVTQTRDSLNDFSQ